MSSLEFRNDLYKLWFIYNTLFLCIGAAPLFFHASGHLSSGWQAGWIVLILCLLLYIPIVMCWRHREHVYVDESEIRLDFWLLRKTISRDQVLRILRSEDEEGWRGFYIQKVDLKVILIPVRFGQEEFFEQVKSTYDLPIDSISHKKARALPKVEDPK
ncbi:MAG TPA: hypothetical protein VK171_01580 [Fimbriimonas sp.]|nr:hypothetical protein [Fimbriimonas sp.]